MSLSAHEVYAMEERYARFNARRTLATTAPSAFRSERIGQARILLNPERAPSCMYNRVLGFTRADIAELPTMARLFREAGSPLVVSVASEDDHPDVSTALTGAGLVPVESLVYMTSRPAAAPSRPELRVERWTEERADAFLDLLAASGVPIPEEVRALRRGFYCTDEFRVHVASRFGRPAGWGTLFVAGDLGYMANAFTFPDHRRNGCQSALLESRLEDGARLGLRGIVTDVVPGSVSERNCRRAGFEPLHTRVLWSPGN